MSIPFIWTINFPHNSKSSWFNSHLFSIKIQFYSYGDYIIIKRQPWYNIASKHTCSCWVFSRKNKSWQINRERAKDMCHLEHHQEDSSKEVALSRGFMDTGEGFHEFQRRDFWAATVSNCCKSLKSNANTEDPGCISESNSNGRKGMGTQGPSG